MTKAERGDLAKLVRMRARVAKNEAEQRAAQLLADPEEQLATFYPASDPAWAEITHAAKQAVADADRQIEQICRERGIAAEFRPSLNVSWYGRGENAVASRRVELRKVAASRIDAGARLSDHDADARAADAQT